MYVGTLSISEKGSIIGRVEFPENYSKSGAGEIFCRKEILQKNFYRGKNALKKLPWEYLKILKLNNFKFLKKVH